ncbi:E3 ubiquitin-protein ligase CCNB1IP1 homolog isoform X2 [Salvia miltiorrhiza]|uniref:E3 ubiquitin-protein ligase CCNB1IP1 homolog isoform X2 n=1 Tax=Salvia miltiorrhiza TaxID=226208 RepID=UPI0025ACE2C5|nr:E3 ubiquitin-protein ligase CCNB1IP1 homolog isoform X2 [Salvia miltiorrhiza]
MRCNACWRELEGRAIATTCGHVLCTEDAGKILSNDGSCPICDQVLSRSLMKPMDINPNDEQANMAMVGISPQTLMKSSYRSIMFYIGQRDLEMQVKMKKIVAQYRQKYEEMQEKLTQKVEEAYGAYQKMGKRCQILAQENENLAKDKLELQEKFSEKCRQKRKLDEMYDEARNEIESLKRSAIQPANNFFSRTETDLFSDPARRLDNRDSIRTGPRDDMWSTRRNNSNSTFDMSGGSPAKQSAIPAETGNRVPSSHPSFGTGVGSRPANPSMTLRNLILSPIKRPQLSRSRPQLFM